MSQLHLTLKPKASLVFADPHRFTMAVCGRRFGKSYLSCAKALQTALSKKRANVLMIAPTFEMGRATLWRTLQDLVPDSWLLKTSESILEMQFLNGSRIEVKSGDRPDRLRGRSLDLVCMDEAAYLTETLWTEVLRPALSDREGSALMTTTPAGTIASWFADLWDDAKAENSRWGRHQYTTIDGGWVTAEEVAQAREMLDPRTFRAEYEASFESPVGRVFPDFGEANISDIAEDDGFSPLAVGCDFNVAHLPGIVCIVRGDELHVVDEVMLHNATTEQLGRRLREKYPRRSMLAYPDPTGGSRKTAAADATVTDHSLLEKAGIRVYERRTPYAVRDKLQTLNWLICDANGRRRLKVHPRCVELIRDLRFCVYKPGTDNVDKISDPARTHASDGLGYCALGAMKPLLPAKYKTRSSQTVSVW